MIIRATIAAATTANTHTLPRSSRIGSRTNGRNAVTNFDSEYAAPAAVPRIAVGYESARYT